MARPKLIDCDECGKRLDLQVPENLALVTGWLHVDTLQGYSGEGEPLGEGIHTHGDFCSLACLAAWADMSAKLEGISD